jgi:outer membrane protein assembly factor BamB
MSSQAKVIETAPGRARARHRWFPWVVIAAAAMWWWWRQATYARYLTVNHLIVVLLCIIAISLWYTSCGAVSRRRRWLIVGGVWLVLLMLLAVFRPVYNGAMGVYKWRLRWSPAADASLQPISTSGEAPDLQTTPSDYPRFLGNGYWAEVKGVALETDWRAQPPQEIWRREIGAGWSAFAVVGNYAVTQEQRGEFELVTCYRVDTGEPVWSHSDKARFDPESAQGALGDIGPRATPTIHEGKVFTQGGTGIVNCLDARTGRVLWSHDTPKEFGATVTVWGKSGSPHVVDDMVVISVGAPEGVWETPETPVATDNYDSSLVAFDIATGDVRWAAGKRQASYASPVLATLAGERQIIVVNQRWVTGHRASDGTVLWEHPWVSETDSDASCSQPVPIDDHRLFLSKGYSVGGACLLSIERDAAGNLSAKPVWDPLVKPVMKTKFCNVVLRDGFVYGLHDVLLRCIALETGDVQWTKRRRPAFGHGQIMLVGDHLLVLSETGELALVEASPKEYRELASMQVLSEENITWNNPAFASPYVLVRNAREAACYRMPLKRK